jgi:hypothetical protein
MAEAIGVQVFLAGFAGAIASRTPCAPVHNCHTWLFEKRAHDCLT